MSKFILDTRLSNAQYVICTEAIRKGVIEPDDLNENQRTMAEQWAFWNNQPPLAAFPSPFAPHIKKGFSNQAVDANSFNGAVNRLARFYQSLGIPVSFNVRGESWHMDVLSHFKVLAAARKIRKQRDRSVLERGESSPAIRYLKHQLHVIQDTGTKKSYFRQPRPKDGFGVTFGDELNTAVKEFQRDHGLKADGIVGSATDKKIDRAYSKTRKRNRASAASRARARASRHSAGKM